MEFQRILLVAFLGCVLCLTWVQGLSNIQRRIKRDAERVQSVVNSERELVRTKREDVKRSSHLHAVGEPALQREKRFKRSPMAAQTYAEADSEPALDRQKRRERRSLSDVKVVPAQRVSQVEKERAKRAAQDRHMMNRRSQEKNSHVVDAREALASRKKRKEDNGRREFGSTAELARLKKRVERMEMDLKVHGRSLNMDDKTRGAASDKIKRLSHYIHGREYERREKTAREKDQARQRRAGPQ